MAVGALTGRWVVVKIGGELATDRAKLAATVGKAVADLRRIGAKVGVVHGGGPQATELAKKLGREPRIIAGRRVTDEEALEVMKMTLAGQVSVDVAASFRMAGVPALCTTGVSAGLVEARRRPPMVITGGPPQAVDLGLVGDVVSVRVDLLETLHAAGLVPVLGSLCSDPQGQVLNINADTVAARIAAALKAERLFLVSNVPGVLRDRNDPASRIPRLTPPEARQQIASGVILGGMIPKVEEALRMVAEGIGAVHIVAPEGLLAEVEAPGSEGTVFHA